MKKYYVNNKAQYNGDHEVHDEDCPFLPSFQNQAYLGTFPDCKAAVEEAKNHHDQVNGCKVCSNECHTQ